MTARLLTVTRKGKVCHLLTSMTDAMRFPGGEMGDLYSHRWEIELGYREIKQTMQRSRLTLRSKKPELVEQELWGVLLAYNLVRYQMIKMAEHLKGYWYESTEFLRIMRNGDENADDIAGRFTGTYTGADARSCKYGTTCEITDKKGKGLPESGKGEAPEIPHSPEKSQSVA